MKEIFSNIQFAKPFFFWLFLALPVLWFRFRDRRLVVLLWRSVILALLILTLADPERVNQQTTQQKRIFAFDLSQSIPDSMRSWMEKSARENFAPTGQDRILVFGSEVKETPDWAEWLSGGISRQGEIQPQKTNLEKLVTTVLALPAAPRSLFLFTDGWETEGNVERLLPSIAGSGLKIFPVLPPDRPNIPNVAVTKLLSPTYGNSGEAFNLKVVLENYNDHEIDGTLTLTRDGQAFRSEALKLKPGSQLFSYQTTLPEGPLTAYRVSFTPRRPEFDNYAPDNQAFAWVTSRSKAKVLVLSGQSGGGRYLEEILKRQGFSVTSRTPDSAPPPTGYGVVIFNNVEREKFSASYLAAIERHVADGNGFLMLGNDASFAPGSYRRTPIETILPVEPREPKREEKNHAVVLVIDKSGSMREENRILYAQAAAKAVARQLKDNDLLGIVGFDITPFIVVPLETVGRLRGVVDAQIDRLRPGGQTYFYPALVEAKRQLERANATRKHVILLSDGETRGSQGELVDLVTVMRNEMKITVSTVAVGSEADIRVMKRISQYGGGVFHYTNDPSNLPQIVLQQLQDSPRDEPQGPRDWTPIQERGSEILAGLSGQSYPSLRGYMETDLKRGGHLDLMVPREDRKAPLMASWRYGRGKTVALTFDLEGRFSRNWIPWSGLQKFWEKTLDWLRPGEEPIPLHEARISLAGNQPVLDLFMYEEASSDSQFRFSVDGKASKADGVLKKLALGHYQSVLPIRMPGDYRISLAEDRRGRRVSLPPLGYTLPHDLNGELPRPDFNTTLLTKLAQTSGGEINPKSSESLKNQEITKSYTPVRQPFIVLALVLFLLEVGFRNLVISEPS
jgi:Ca-activated chloride channel family protein